MPSGRRSKPPETDSPVFFLDRSLGRVHVAAALRDRGLDVVLMAEFYPDGSDQRIADDQWIADVSAIGHVALTKDTNLIRDHRSVLGRSTLRLFAIDTAKLTGPEMAERVDRHLDRILLRARKPGPYAYVIHKEDLELRWRPGE